ncbi:MAG: tetratricopeptide repeat protein [Xanthomonadales bacterium]|nr:tetratricopeptide repeat protein [Xanthomonadales bacterium]
MRLIIISLFLLLFLSACASTGPAPSNRTAPPVLTEVETEVRQPASEESAGIQVQPLQNPAVRQLLASASASESAGQLEQAAQMLERGLRIEPRDPELLQRMAEIRLQQEAWQQAISFATRSFDMGAQTGELCARNWRTMALANEYLKDPQAAAAARTHIDDCMRQRPKKY